MSGIFFGALLSMEAKYSSQTLRAESLVGTLYSRSFKRWNSVLDVWEEFWDLFHC